MHKIGFVVQNIWSYFFLFDCGVRPDLDMSLIIGHGLGKVLTHAPATCVSEELYVITVAVQRFVTGS